ncbi:MAG TPA: hypothetical protein VIF62_38250 [Labilithrix sp.]
MALVLVASPASAASQAEIAAAVKANPCALVVDGPSAISAMTTASSCVSGFSVGPADAQACHGPAPIAWSCVACSKKPMPPCSSEQTGTATLGGSVRVGDESYAVTGTASYTATIRFEMEQSELEAAKASGEQGAFTYYATIADSSVTKQSLAGGTATVETPDGKVTVPMPSGVDCGFASAMHMTRSVSVEKRTCDAPIESKPSNKMELGLGVGGALPFGKADGGASGVDLADEFGAAVPVQFDVAYRSAGGVSIGARLGIAAASVASKACPATLTCDAYIVHTGIEAKWHFAPTEIVEPWIGLGVGWEWAHESTTAIGTGASNTLSGFELANLMCGAELRLADAWAVGPFASLSFAEYTTTTRSSITDKAFHEWLTLGVRGAYGLALP